MGTAHRKTIPPMGVPIPVVSTAGGYNVGCGRSDFEIGVVRGRGTTIQFDEGATNGRTMAATRRGLRVSMWSPNDVIMGALLVTLP